MAYTNDGRVLFIILRLVVSGDGAVLPRPSIGKGCWRTAGLSDMIADERVSLGIVLGAIVIITAPILTFVYVRWANRHYDPAIHAVRNARSPAKSPTPGSNR